MSKKSDLVKSTLILGFGKLSTQFAAFVLLPIYTIFLSPEQFGAVDLIISYIALLAPLIMIQLDRAAFRLLIEARGDDAKSRVVISNTLYIVVGALALAALLYGAVNLLVGIPHAGLIAVAIVWTIFSTLFLQLARGFGQNTKFAIASIITGLVNLAVSVSCVVGLGMGVEGVLWAVVVSQLASTLYLFVSLRLHRYISVSSEVSSVVVRRELIDFAWPLVPSAVSWWFIRTFDRTLVTIFLGVAANGVYAAANRYALIFNALYSIFDLSWTESASAHINSRDRDKFFSDVYNTSFRFFGSLGLMMLVVTPFVFGFIIGDEFRDAYWYIPVLLLGGLFNAAVAQYSVIYIAKKKTKEVLITSLSAAALSIVLNLTLIPVLGILGAAIALAAAFFMMAVWRHFDIKKYVTVTFTGGIFAKLALVYAFAFALYYANNMYLNIANLLITGAVAFVLSRRILLGGLKATWGRVVGLRLHR